MDEREYSSDVEYETDNKDKKKKKIQLTRGMLLLIIAIFIIIIAVIIIVVSKEPTDKKPEYTKEDFKKLEERMKEEAGAYYTNNNINVDQGSSKKISLSELLLENGGSIDKTKVIAANVCDGYVLVTKDSEVVDFKPYIDCGNYYKTQGYSSNDKTTTKKIKDTIAPTITVIGEKELTINVGNDYKDSGAKATDDTDGDLTPMIKVTGSVNTKKVGKYTIEYSVSDSSGNKSVASRIINVVEVRTTTVRQTEKTTTRYTNKTNSPTTAKPRVCTEVPDLTLKSRNGAISVTLKVGESYMEPGYSATDCNGNNITSNVSVSSNVNVNSAGTYQIVYSVTDFNGRTTKKTRTVFVKSVYVKVESISITPNNLSIQKGKTMNIVNRISINPSTATDKSLSFYSSNSNAVSVDQAGNITGIKKGATATITIKASNNATTTCIVKVE